MTAKVCKTDFETPILSMLERLPFISVHVRAKGWPFILSWCHRVAGNILVVYVWFHILSLESLYTPQVFAEKMAFYNLFVFRFLEWMLAVLVIFHALNGGRLMLYESFGTRNDGQMIRWIFSLSTVYVLQFGLFMILGDQRVSPVFFWLPMLITAVIVGFVAGQRIWKAGHAFFWKFQRISGAFLLVMVPAHLLFMHLNPSVGKESSVVIMRMQSHFIKVVDQALLLAALYHGGYGLVSILNDYLSSRTVRTGLALLITAVMCLFAWKGIKLTFTIG